MKALLDTHTALFAWMAPEKLSARVRKIIRNRKNELYFSQASTLEIVLKHKIGKMTLPESPVSYVATRVQVFGFRYLPIEDADIQGISDLPMVHRDPFDWLLLATAQRLSLPMISRDSFFAKYPVELVWS